MEPKLQQAIVATRAGRTDIAQTLLTQLIYDNPEDANAWFLLSHIVEPPERQAQYLKKAIELEPDNAIAQQHLTRLEDKEKDLNVPAPVIREQSQVSTVAGQEVDAHSIDEYEQETVPATAVLATLSRENNRVPNTPEVEEGAFFGRPLREQKNLSTQIAESSEPSSVEVGSKGEEDKLSTEEILVRVLVLMVVVAAIVLGILVLFILI
jgi:hypothetical protein